MCSKIAWCLVLTVLGWILFTAVAPGSATHDDGEVDWTRARQLLEKSRQGAALTAEEQAYLQRAQDARAQGARPQQQPARIPPSDPRAAESLEKQNHGLELSAEEKSYLEQARQTYERNRRQRPAPPPTTRSTGLIPLDQMTAEDRYKGEDGGLYGGGSNQPPAAHQKAADRELAQIVPRGPDGRKSRDGRIVLLSIGMSNTTQEFSRFKQLADRDPGKSPMVVIVDGAQGGMDGERWSSPDTPAWRVLENRLKQAGVTAQQVQAIWMKHARIGPARFGAWPKHGAELKGHVIASLHLARERFPNLRVAYLSSRIYAGCASTPLNPEPYAYESALVVRGIIREQIASAAALNFDVAKGSVKAPLLLWGPYLWADGTTPRKSDGLVWNREDLAGDGTHPSPTNGRDKVARILLDFFKTNPNARQWFTGAAAEQD